MQLQGSVRSLQLICLGARRLKLLRVLLALSATPWTQLHKPDACTSTLRLLTGISCTTACLGELLSGYGVCPTRMVWPARAQLHLQPSALHSTEPPGT